jgi:antitoxin HicB
MRYPAKFHHEPQGGFSITFPDIPEAITQGDDLEDGMQQASDALETAIDIYFDEKRSVPLPSVPKRGQKLVDLPASIAAKVLLHNELLAQGIERAELARRIGMPRQHILRLLDPHHNTKIDTLQLALQALGKHLEVRIG